jgi:hypothetical protein
MLNFCTYFDKNYLSKFLVLKESVESLKSQNNFYILALDDFVKDFFKQAKMKNVQIICLKDLEQEYKNLIIAKNNRDLIEYYFTLSPFLPRYIFEKFRCSNISYVDSDFFFYKNPIDFFFQNKKSSITLIKQKSKSIYGRFNVGLINFNFNFSETLEILNTWSEQCLNSCVDIPNIKKNLYADQKYLDEWPKKLKNIKVICPENSVLSPWDNNDSIEKNINNIFAFHFHGFQIYNNFFFTGFSNYNKKPSKIILKKFYIPYAKKIFNTNIRYNLKINSVRNLSKKKIIRLRKLKFFIKKLIYLDIYKFD